MSRRQSLIVARRTGLGAAAVTVVAIGVLTVVCTLAAVAEYGRASPVDGYGLGPLPWTPIVIGVLLAGGTLTAVAGGAAAWLDEGWGHRVLGTAGIASTALWWATAPLMGAGGACCYPAPPFDPITIAYSSPGWAAMLILLPAAVMATSLLVRRIDRAGPRGAASSYISPS